MNEQKSTCFEVWVRIGMAFGTSSPIELALSVLLDVDFVPVIGIASAGLFSTGLVFATNFTSSAASFYANDAPARNIAQKKARVLLRMSFRLT